MKTMQDSYIDITQLGYLSRMQVIASAVIEVITRKRAVGNEFIRALSLSILIMFKSQIE